MKITRVLRIWFYFVFLRVIMFNRLRIFLQQFVFLSDEDFSTFKELIIVKEYKKKHLLISAGEIEQYIYYLDKGLIHQYFYKGKEVVTTDIIPEGTTVNAAVSFFSGKPSHYYLETIEPTRLLALSKEHLYQLYRSDKKWRRMGRLLLSHFLIRQEKNILDNLRYSMRERFIRFAQEYPGLMERVPQRRLASYLNIKPETYTRLKPLLSKESRGIHSTHQKHSAG